MICLIVGLVSAQTSESDAWRSLGVRAHLLEPPPEFQKLGGNSFECQYFGHMYSFEVMFTDYFLANPRNQARWEDADFVVLPHCITYAYHILRYSEGYNTVHLTWEALRIVQEEYLLPLVRWAKQHPAYGKKPFVIVYSMDKGRADYPLVSEETKDWIAVTTVGNPQWMEINQPWTFPLEAWQTSDPCHNQTSVSQRGLIWYPQDVVAPVVTTFAPTNKSFDTRQRDILFFFSGTANSCTRKMLVSEFKRDKKRYFVTDEPMDKMEYAKILYRSRYCLVPDGFSPISARLFEVLLHGCVPVIISEAFHPPFETMMDWRSMALFVKREQVPNLEQYLDTVGDAYFSIQQRSAELSKVFDSGVVSFWLALFSSMMNQVDQFYPEMQKPSLPEKEEDTMGSGIASAFNGLFGYWNS